MGAPVGLIAVAAESAAPVAAAFPGFAAAGPALAVVFAAVAAVGCVPAVVGYVPYVTLLRWTTCTTHARDVPELGRRARGRGRSEREPNGG